jgi:hypothetical protein
MSAKTQLIINTEGSLNLILKMSMKLLMSWNFIEHKEVQLKRLQGSLCHTGLLLEKKMSQWIGMKFSKGVKRIGENLLSLT